MASRSRNKIPQSKEELYALLKQKAPEIADFVLSELESTDKPIEDIIADAIRFKYMVLKTTLSNMSIDQLLAAFEFWDMIYRRALQSSMITVGLWQALAQIFTAFMDIYSSIYQTAHQAAEQSVSNDARLRMVEMFERYMDRMMERMERLMTLSSQPLMVVESQFKRKENEDEDIQIEVS